MANIRNAFEKLRGIIPEKINEISSDYDMVREARSAEEHKYGESMAARRGLKNEKSPERLKKLIQFYQDRLEVAETPEDKGRLRSIINDLYEMWREKDKKRIQYIQKDTADYKRDY